MSQAKIGGTSRMWLASSLVVAMLKMSCHA